MRVNWIFMLGHSCWGVGGGGGNGFPLLVQLIIKCNSMLGRQISYLSPSRGSANFRLGTLWDLTSCFEEWQFMALLKCSHTVSSHQSTFCDGWMALDLTMKITLCFLVDFIEFDFFFFASRRSTAKYSCPMSCFFSLHNVLRLIFLSWKRWRHVRDVFSSVLVPQIVLEVASTTADKLHCYDHSLCRV